MVFTVSVMLGLLRINASFAALVSFQLACTFCSAPAAARLSKVVLLAVVNGAVVALSTDILVWVWF